MLITVRRLNSRENVDTNKGCPFGQPLLFVFVCAWAILDSRESGNDR